MAANAANLVSVAASTANMGQIPDEADTAFGQRWRRVGSVADDWARHEGSRTGTGDWDRPAGHRQRSRSRPGVQRRVGRLWSEHVITVHVLATNTRRGRLRLTRVQVNLTKPVPSQFLAVSCSPSICRNILLVVDHTWLTSTAGHTMNDRIANSIAYF